MVLLAVRYDSGRVSSSVTPSSASTEITEIFVNDVVTAVLDILALYVI